MRLEIEAKVRVADLAPVRKRLVQAGARRLGAVGELNLLFDCFDPGQRRRLRLRLLEPIDGPAASEAILTFKGKRMKGAFKSRREIEVAVRDTDQMQHLLTAIGYRLRFQYQKRREEWSLGDVSISLDLLPHIGSFVEVEGVREEDVCDVVRLLGLEERPVLRKGYASLLRRHLRRAGLDASRACFESLPAAG